MSLKLRLKLLSSGDQNECVLYANNGDTEYSASMKSATNGWTDVVIKDIEVRNGECEIGVRSDANAGNYVRFDDMYFTRNSDCEALPVEKEPLRLVDDGGNTVYETAAGTEGSGIETDSVIPGDDTEAIKLFLWDNTQKPFINAIEIK